MTQDIEPAASRSPALIAIVLFIALWGGSTAYLAFKGADWTFPPVSLGVFGLALPGLVWLLTRGARPAVRPSRFRRWRR